jgi:hypothetical protein
LKYRSRWEENTKVYIKGIIYEDVHWFHLSPNRDQGAGFYEKSIKLYSSIKENEPVRYMSDI